MTSWELGRWSVECELIDKMWLGRKKGFARKPCEVRKKEVGTAITAPKTCFRQIEFAGILKEAKNRDPAEKWIDFMLSVPYQEDLPLNQFVYPVKPQAKLPEAFTKWSSVA